MYRKQGEMIGGGGGGERQGVESYADNTSHSIDTIINGCFIRIKEH